jgi:8-oxo-dGTP pyrophosphatase MutT (NUDIX family)
MVPKGLVGLGEDPMAAAVREFEEETGIKPTPTSRPLTRLMLGSAEQQFCCTFSQIDFRQQPCRIRNDCERPCNASFVESGTSGREVGASKPSTASGHRQPCRRQYSREVLIALVSIIPARSASDRAGAQQGTRGSGRLADVTV